MRVGADIITFGHSLKALMDGIMDTIMNPGSVSLPYGRNNKQRLNIEIKENKEYDIYLQKI